MDETKRRITKIAREVRKFATRTLKVDGIGTGEFDYIHVIRKNPGITQAGIREILGIDKGAAARRATSLEEKGYLYREPNPQDRRSQLLYPTDRAERLKNSKASVEAAFYEWLLADLTEDDMADFVRILNQLYEKSKAESRSGFLNVTAFYTEKGGGA